MPKFFVAKEKINGDVITIDTDDISHIKRVLRLNTGDVITICDSAATDYTAEITELSDKAVICHVLSKEKNDAEPNISVTLFQALPKATKMELIIQKNTELGIVRVVPCELSRCVVKLDGKDSKKKCERWQKIADEAAKQSGRGILPTVSNIMSFKDAVCEMKKSDIFFVPYESAEEITLKSILSGNEAKSVSFMIGPEGGFSPEEVEFLMNENVPLVTLGKRILRTETAGMAVLSMIMYEIGDINKG